VSERSRALRKSFYARLAVFGFALIFVSIIVAGATGNAPGAFSFVPPALIALIVALVLWLSGRGLIVALVISVLALLLFAIGEVLGGLPALGHPESVSDFVPALMRAVGSVMAFAGTLIAFRQARRGPGALQPGSPRQKRLVKIGTAGLVVVAVVSAVLTYTRNADIDAPPGASVVETFEDHFSPTELSLEEGPHTVLVVNRDSYAHTFSVDELDLDVYIGPRADRLITFDVPDDPGRHDLYCAVTGHEDMTGTVEFS
jgi:hypothetical protein